MHTKKNYLDILRVLAIFMVFHFHFIIVLEKQGILYGFTNGDWGCVGTSLFFLISGNCLARNYGKELNVKKFYIKRWLALFPAFYICYLLVLIGHTVLLQNHVLAGVAPWRMIFTILGIDNYLNFFGIQNGALVGEWYTAIILLIYLLFPVLQFLYKKSKLIGSILVMSLYFLNLRFTWGSVPDDAHLITGIAMFWIGMMIYYLEEKVEHMSWLIWGAVLLLGTCLVAIPLPGLLLFYKNLMAICIFLLFMRVGTLFSKKEEPGIICFLSKIEYGIYLCHHTVFYVLKLIYTHILGEINPVLYYCLCLVTTIAFATVITYLTQWIVSKVKSITIRNELMAADSAKKELHTISQQKYNKP